MNFELISVDENGEVISMIKFEDLPKKKKAKYPKKISISVPQEIWAKWIELGDLDFEPADKVRPLLISMTEDMWKALDSNREKLHEKKEPRGATL